MNKYPLKLNLGCGFDKKDGYFNVDLNAFHKPDLVADATSLPQLPSNYFDEIIAQDLLEHLPRSLTVIALKEWNRLLKTGGKLFLRIPNLTELLKLFGDNNKTDLKMNNEIVHCLYGTQAYNGDFHLNGFTKIIIESLLEESGFTLINITSKDGWLMEILAEKSREKRTPLNPNPLHDNYLFLENWYEIENDGNSEYRWGQKSAWLNFKNYYNRTACFDLFSNYPDINVKNISLLIINSSNSKIIQKILFTDNRLSHVQFEIKQKNYVLELYSDISWVPAYWMNNNDYRDLGIGIKNFQIT